MCFFLELNVYIHENVPGVTFVICGVTSCQWCHHLIVPFCRLSITNSSFIPSTVKEWNKLDIVIRKLDSLSKFKNAIRLNSQSNKISVPKLYYYGSRKLNVILTQLLSSTMIYTRFIFYLAQRDTPRLQYYDVQTLEYRYISKLPMKNERIWNYVKETTSHLQNKLTKNIHLRVATRSSTKWDCLKPIRFL